MLQGTSEIISTSGSCTFRHVPHTSTLCLSLILVPPLCQFCGLVLYSSLYTLPEVSLGFSLWIPPFQPE